MSHSGTLHRKAKKKSLDEREKIIYAPFSGVGGIVYDKDAVYIDLGGSHHQNKGNKTKVKAQSEPSSELVATMIDTEYGLDEKIEESELRFFSKSEPIKSSEVQGLKNKLQVEQIIDEETGRSRNKVNFNDDLTDFENDGNDEDEESNEEEFIDKDLSEDISVMSPSDKLEIGFRNFSLNVFIAIYSVI